MVEQRSQLTRRGFLGLTGLAAAAGAGLVSGCSSFSAGVLAAEKDPEQVSFWNLWAGGDGERATEMIRVYRAQHGADSLEATTFSWGNPYYTKLSLATLGQRPPDIAVAHVTRLKSLQRAGLVTKLDDGIMSAAGLSADDFVKQAWEAALIDGDAYCLPYDVGPIVLFYNTDLCGKAGLLDGDKKLKPIQGAEDFKAALTAAKKAGAEEGAVWTVINDPGMNWRWFNSLYTQKGGTPFLSDEGREISMDEDLAASTLEYLQTMTRTSGLVPSAVDYAGSVSAFGSGKAAFLVMGCWEVVTMEDVGVPFGMTTLPQLFDQPAVWADSHVLVLPTDEARTTDQTQRAMGFGKSLLDQSLTWAQGGAIPSWQKVLSSPDYQKLEPQSAYTETLPVAVYDPAAWYGGAGSNFMEICGSQIGLVQQGLTSVSSAVTSMRSQLMTYAQTPDPL